MAKKKPHTRKPRDPCAVTWKKLERFLKKAKP